MIHSCAAPLYYGKTMLPSYSLQVPLRCGVPCERDMHRSHTRGPCVGAQTAVGAGAGPVGSTGATTSAQRRGDILRTVVVVAATFDVCLRGMRSEKVTNRVR